MDDTRDGAGQREPQQLTAEELFTRIEKAHEGDVLFDELRERFANMQEQIERVTALKLEGLTYERGKLDIKVSFELCRILANHFWNILESAEAQNYVELHMVDQSQGRTAALEFNAPDTVEKIVILIQRSLGQTPHQLRRTAEERYEALRFGFAAVAQMLIDAVSGATIDSAAVVNAQVEAVKVALAHHVDLTIPFDPEDAASTIAAEAENGNSRSDDCGGSGLPAGSEADAAPNGGSAGGDGEGVRGEDAEHVANDRDGGAPERGGHADDREPEVAGEEEAGQAGGTCEEGVPPPEQG